MILVYGSKNKCDEFYVLWYNNDTSNSSNEIKNEIQLFINDNLTDLYELDYELFKLKKYIGPIKTVDSVFSTSITDLLNKTLPNRPVLKIELFRTYNMGYSSIDFMLEDIYDFSVEDPNKLGLVNLKNDINDNDINDNDNAKLDDDSHTTLTFDMEIDLSSKEQLETISTSKYRIGFDAQELDYYKELFRTLNRNPTLIELFDLCQSNSEHSRHWFFKGKYDYGNNSIDDISLFKHIKSTLPKISNSLVAFSDNSSVIRGNNTRYGYINKLNQYETSEPLVHSVLTAETHNFPTLICPFEGASTGVGGRIRDNQSTGRGADIIMSSAGYIVGDILRDNIDHPFVKPIDMIIEASNGASDYGNKIGEPITSGFSRSISYINNGIHYEHIKPVMFSAGIGSILDKNTVKHKIEKNDRVVRIGGPAFKIGLGGGHCSSISNQSNNLDSYKDAVQRGDPQMCNKLNRVIRRISLLELELELDSNVISGTDSPTPKNPIISIHDQGAGGLANVVKEIIYPNGGVIDLSKVSLGDKNMDPLEIWCSEFQESCVIVVKPKDIGYIEKVCFEENICCDNLGYISDTLNIDLFFKTTKLMTLPLKEILEPDIRKTFELSHNDNLNHTNIYPNRMHDATLLGIEPSIDNIDNIDNIDILIHKILKDPDVCSKRFLTTKVDRSVTGLIAQQQCVGHMGIPLSNYSISALSYFSKNGTVSSIGERTYLGIFNNYLQVDYSICEMLSNMVGCYIGEIENIKCSVNWMWPNNAPGESVKLHQSAVHLSNCLKQLGIGVDGGKDSLSMSINHNSNSIISPGSVVVTGYCPCKDIMKKVTPNIKEVGSYLIKIPFINKNKNSNSTSDKPTLIGSIASKYLNQQTLEYPASVDMGYVKKVFQFIQDLILNDKILSLHDISDGGTITTIFEMCYSGGIGCNIDINPYNKQENIDYSILYSILYNKLFSEEPGIIIEVSGKNREVLDYITNKNKSELDSELELQIIGNTISKLEISFSDNIINSLKLDDLVKSFESTASMLEKKQCENKLVDIESRYILENYKNERTKVLNNIYIPPNILERCCRFNITPLDKKVLILRDEGSNGDMEMCGYFKYCGYHVLNYNSNQIEQHLEMINTVDGIVFVGGFTYSDMMGAASCWNTRLRSNPQLYEMLLTFFSDQSKFVIGVCNGFQLLIKMGVFGNHISLKDNLSGRFESRYLPISVCNTNNRFTKNLKDVRFGMWVAHKSGRIEIDYKGSINNDFIPILKYSNGGNDNEYENYPLNPNGSFDNIAGVCNKHGNIMGLMPHFERSFIDYQIPYIPPKYKNIKVSPWINFAL